MILRDGVDAYTLQKIRLKLEILLTDLIGSAAEKEPASVKSTKWEKEYANALSFLKANIHRSLTLAEIAEGCSMSVSKLKMLFREKYGGGALRSDRREISCRNAYGRGDFGYAGVSAG